MLLLNGPFLMLFIRYPIYRIPMGPTLKDLDACFLTFHSLHTPTTGHSYISYKSPWIFQAEKQPFFIVIKFTSCITNLLLLFFIFVSGNECEHPPVVRHFSGTGVVSLPAFGLASYKFKAPLWVPNEWPLMTSLLEAADTWLTSLQVNHPDYLFFSRR